MSERTKDRMSFQVEENSRCCSSKVVGRALRSINGFPARNRQQIDMANKSITDWTFL